MALHPPLNRRTLCAQLKGALREFRRIADDDTGPDLDVRVVVDVGDNTWWLATGGVQYDTVHGDVCAAGTLCVSMTPDEVDEVAGQLCDEVDDGVAEYIAMSCASESV